MSEKKYSPEDVAKILRACNTPGSDCRDCPADHCSEFNSSLLAADAIEELLAKLEAQRWVPVGERLPALVPCGAAPGHGYSEAVQICTDGKKVLTAVYSHEGWIFARGFWEAWDEEVTHWRPVVGDLPWAGEGV